jgi:hypothetical protein
VARERLDGGTVRPSASAVLRLTTNSNLVGCWTGRSAGLVALKDLSGVDADLTNRVGEARSIADQTAGRGKSTPVSDRRNSMACSQCHELVASLAEKRIGTKDERQLQLARGL